MSGHSKWANIKHRKGKMDALRGKVTTKISREIYVAVRNGGADPAMNMRLKLALQKAKENNVTKDNVQRAIQKAQGGADGTNFEEMTYEGYGPGGAAVLLDTMSDNRNRTVADVRHLFSKYGGNLGETGCVNWMFNKKGLIIIEDIGSVDEDELMLAVLDAGADDFVNDDGIIEITTSPEAFDEVQEKLAELSITTSSANVSMVPETEVVLVDHDAAKMEKLIDALEELDDVQEVYTNADLSALEDNE